MRFFRLVWPHLWYDAACCGLRSGRRPFVVDPPASGRAGVAVVARGGGEGAGAGRGGRGVRVVNGDAPRGGGGVGGGRGPPPMAVTDPDLVAALDALVD